MHIPAIATALRKDPALLYRIGIPTKPTKKWFDKLTPDKKVKLKTIKKDIWWDGGGGPDGQNLYPSLANNSDSPCCKSA